MLRELIGGPWSGMMVEVADGATAYVMVEYRPIGDVIEHRYQRRWLMLDATRHWFGFVHPTFANASPEEMLTEMQRGLFLREIHKVCKSHGKYLAVHGTSPLVIVKGYPDDTDLRWLYGAVRV